MTAGAGYHVGRAIEDALPFLWVVFFVCLIFAVEPWGYALFLLAATALHETGHLFAFLLCGERLPAFSGRRFGLLLTPQGGALSYKKELLIAAAGPFFNLLACLALIPAMRAGRAAEANFCFFALNLLTAVFNLLPIAGFDGGRVLSAALHLSLPTRVADGITGGVSVVFAVVFYFCTLFLALCAGGSIYPLLLSLFLLVGEARRYPSLFEDLGVFKRKSKHFLKKSKNPKSYRN